MFCVLLTKMMQRKSIPFARILSSIVIIYDNDIEMGKVAFTVVKQVGNARVADFSLNGVRLEMPVFMPV